jgi:GPH family glycoside/pentoside/hexuronide:cation symporter
MSLLPAERSVTLTWSATLGYSAPALGAAVLGVLFYVYIPNLYSEELKVPLGIVGIIVFFSRVWDAIIDPLVGYLSDRTRSRFGRRRIWIAVSLLPLAVTFYLLCAPPRSLSVSAASWWLALGTFTFFLFWTTLSIPYEALGTELSDDYHERNRLYAVRQGVIVVGTLLAGVLPVVFAGAAPEQVYARWGEMGFWTGVLVVLGGGGLLLTVRENRVSAGPPPSRDLLGAIACVKKNRPFLVLLAAYTLSGFGASLPATLIVYYVKYVIGADSPAKFLTVYFAVGFLFLPAWLWVARKVGKRDAWIYSMLVNTGAFIAVVPLGHGDEGLYMLLVALSGIGYGGSLALPASMQADVLDLEAFERGARREGEFIALWSISSKLAAAFGSGVAFPILSATGYAPNVAQSAKTVFMLSLLYAGVPSLCNLLAIVVARQYQLTEGDHEVMRKALHSRTENKESP